MVTINWNNKKILDERQIEKKCTNKWEKNLIKIFLWMFLLLLHHASSLKLNSAYIYVYLILFQSFSITNIKCESVYLWD